MACTDSVVVVIGSGFCGLIATKIFLENGFNVTCFEKTGSIGGLWRFREDEHGEIGSVTRNTIINTSKEMSAMSDFPPDAKSANYMHNSEIMKYLEQYIEKFQLLPHIQFNHEVLKVSKAKDYEETGKWLVQVLNKDTGENSDVQARAVLVCIGHHVFPNIVNFPGKTEFGGTIMHTHSFKDSADFKGKKVMVVGVGNSGMDAAVELSFVANRVYLSTRRGGWVLQRVGPSGVPSDFATTRWNAFLHKHFRNYFLNKLEKQANIVFDHELYNMKPQHRIDGQHLTISDSLPSCIMSGGVIVKGDISRLTRSGVIFEEEEDVEYEVDAIVTATGYDIRFPFLNGYVSTSNNVVELFRRLIPLHLQHPTLAIIGLVQPSGAIFPVAEIQCRWLAKVIKGEIKMPSQEECAKEVVQYKSWLRDRYFGTQRHTIEVDFVPYLDSFAKDVGCKPNLFNLFFTDHKLFQKLLYGPAVAYQYRLHGPHAWPEARHAIMTVDDRMRAAFNNRYPRQKSQIDKRSKDTQYIWGFLVTVVSSIGIYYAYSNNLLHGV